MFFPDLRSSTFSTNYTSFTSEKSLLHLWHNRLGHYSFYTVKNIIKQCEIPYNDRPIFCDVCVTGKAN